MARLLPFVAVAALASQVMSQVCPNSNTQVFISNGQSMFMQCYTDYEGTPTETVMSNSVAYCGDECAQYNANNPGSCPGVVFRPSEQVCNFYGNGLGQFGGHSTDWETVLEIGSVPTTNQFTSNPNCGSNLQDNQKFYYVNGSTYQILCQSALNIQGQTPETTVTTNTLGECALICAQYAANGTGCISAATVPVSGSTGPFFCRLFSVTSDTYYFDSTSGNPGYDSILSVYNPPAPPSTSITTSTSISSVTIISTSSASTATTSATVTTAASSTDSTVSGSASSGFSTSGASTGSAASAMSVSSASAASAASASINNPTIISSASAASAMSVSSASIASISSSVSAASAASEASVSSNNPTLFSSASAASAASFNSVSSASAASAASASTNNPTFVSSASAESASTNNPTYISSVSFASVERIISISSASAASVASVSTNNPTYISSEASASAASASSAATNNPTFISSASAASAASAQSATQTMSTTSASSSATSFALAIQTANNAKRLLHNRQSTEGYIAADGSSIADCSAAQHYTIQSGQLFAVNGGQISTSPDVAYIVFQPSSTVGSITTNFSLQSGALSWTNAAFTNNAAAFCLNNGVVYATFGSDTSICGGSGSVTLAADFCAISPVSSSAATASTAAPPAPTATVNNYYNNVTYNNAVYNININLGAGITSLFDNGTISYYTNDPIFYYAKLCPVCPIVQVYSSNNTFASPCCASCMPSIYQIASCSGNNGASAVATYGSTSCLSCQTNSALAVVSADTTLVAVPTSATAAVQAFASASGASAAVAAAASAMSNFAVAGTPASGASAVAPSTVVNAGAGASQVAVTVAQTPAAGASSNSGGASSGSSGSSSSGGSSAVKAFTSAASKLENAAALILGASSVLFVLLL